MVGGWGNHYLVSEIGHYNLNEIKRNENSEKY